MAIDRHAGTNFVLGGEARVPISLDGRLFTRWGLSPTTTGTTEQTLASVVIPRGLISGDKKALHVWSWWLGGNNANSKIARLRLNTITGTILGATSSAAFNSAAQGPWDVWLGRISKQSYQGLSRVTGAATTTSSVAITDDLSDGFTLLVTGTTGVQAGDLTLQALSVRLITEGSQ